MLNFFIKINKLKEMPRTGWVLRGVKNPETVAEHIFGVVFLIWLLGEKKSLNNMERAIKIALLHDICEVYAGDMTPFYYYVKPPRKLKSEAERKKLYDKWVRLSKKEKEKRGRKKFTIEKKSLLKLIKDLKYSIKKEILACWYDYEKRTSREGKFAKQIDVIETLIQSIVFFGPEERIGGSCWWEGAEEIVEDPLLLEFLKVIEKKFYGRVIGEYKRDRELENILDFILEIGKLKKMPRSIWTHMGIKKPETVASHCFSVALLALILGNEKKGLNVEKIIKMALCHEIASVYTDDLMTPYSRTLPKTKKEGRKIFTKWPRLSKKEKRAIFLRDYKKEKTALEQLTFRLESSLKKEIVQLWDDYKNTRTKEARFVNQLNVLAVLIQALLYQKKDKDLPIEWLWEWAFEKCDDPVILESLEELKKKFYKGNFIFQTISNLLRIKQPFLT